MTNRVSFLISLALVSVALSCRRSNDNQLHDPPPVPVTTFRLTSENVTYYDSYPCTITALKEVGLRGEVTGYITGIFFKEGSKVTKGQKLYEIDRRQYESALKEANDNLKIAQANLARIQLDVDRYNALNNQEAIARQKYDYALTDLANARLQVSVASEEQVKAATNLEYSLITAPFDGTIGISQVKMGDLITPGATLLNTISSDDPVAADFVIDQSELTRFEEMQKMKSESGDSTFRLVLPDNSLYRANGKIDLIDRAVDPQTGTIRVRTIFSNANGNLRPGMDCDVRVIHASPGPQILIPYKAVLEQMSEYFVFCVRNSKAAEIKVLLGPRVGSGVIIKEGLNPGDTLVVDGISKLTDGASVASSPLPGQEQQSMNK